MKNELRSPREWSFSYLLGFQPWHLNSPAPDTVAYWLLQLRRDLIGESDAKEWAARMSIQLDREDQATSERDVYSDSLMPEAMRPMSPVSLAQLWSPIPLAVDILGEPVHHDLSSAGEALVFWHTRDTEVEIDDFPPDVSFFQDTLSRMLKAARLGSFDSLALIAAIGWSYERPKLGRAQRKLLEQLGYVKTSRRP